MPPIDIAQRLRALESRKRAAETLLDAARLGLLPGVSTGNALPERAPQPRAADRFLSAFPEWQAQTHDGLRVLTRCIDVLPGRIAGQQLRLPIPPDDAFPDRFLPAPDNYSFFLPPRASGPASLCPGEVAFLDTETTNLSAGPGTLAFLVGVGAWRDDPTDGWVFRLEQYFIEDYEHEPALLHLLRERLAGVRVLVHYNGRSFDVPLLRARARMNRMPVDWLDGPAPFDLLTPARRLWSGSLDSVSLKSVESHVLGIDRGPDVSGAEIPAIYQDFLRAQRTDALRRVLHHHAQDIVSLGALLGHLGRAVRAPLGGGLHRGGEFIGLARWYRKQGNRAAALPLYLRALECADVASREDDLQWEVATIFRQLGRWEEALALWQGLCRRPLATWLRAWEAVAKYHEHTRKCPEDALRAVLECLERADREAELAALTGPTSRFGVLNDRQRAGLEKRARRLLGRVSSAHPRTSLFKDSSSDLEHRLALIRLI